MKEAIINFILFPFIIVGLIPFHLMKYIGSNNNDLNYLGLLLFIPSICILMKCLYIFKKDGESIVPWSIPNGLITKGPYKYSRNPIFVSMLTIAIGWAVLLSSLMHLMYVALLLVIFYRRILKEEKRLLNIFNGKWEIYCQKTPRWI